MAFVYPTAADYTAAIGRATYDLQYFADMPVEAGGIISPPMMTQLSALTATIEQSSGMSIAELASLAGSISQLVQATTPLAVVGAVEGVLNNVQAVVETIMSAMDVASDAIAVVPVVGQIVGFVFGVIKLFLGTEAAWQKIKKECRRDLRRAVNKYCKAVAEGSAPKATSVNPVTGAVVPGPGDWFRNLAMTYQSGSGKYPFNVSSILLMLCGGASTGFGMSEERYQEIVELHQKGFNPAIGPSIPPRPVGIPMATRLRMWGLIKAIMASVQNPDTKKVHFVADNGRAAMPLLLDIVNNEYWALKEGKGHGIDELFIRSMATQALSWTRREVECCAYAAGIKTTKCETIVDMGCGKPERNIVDNMAKQFESVRYDFNFRLYNAFVDPETGLWRTGVPGGTRTVAAATLGAQQAFADRRREAFMKNLGALALGAGLGYGVTRLFQSA